MRSVVRRWSNCGASRVYGSGLDDGSTSSTAVDDDDGDCDGWERWRTFGCWARALCLRRGGHERVTACVVRAERRMFASALDHGDIPARGKMRRGLVDRFNESVVCKEKRAG